VAVTVFASYLFVAELNTRASPFSTPAVLTSLISAKAMFGFGAKVSAAMAVFGDDLIVARPIVPVVFTLAVIAIIELLHQEC
jgi:hypothetical protein